MRRFSFSSLWLSLAVLPLTEAQSISDLVNSIPRCADDCFVTKVSLVCPGGLSAFSCQCDKKNHGKIDAILTPCVAQACSTSDEAKARSLYDEICMRHNAQESGSPSPSSTGSSSSQTSSAASHSGGLSTGTSAGIGVGVAVVVLAVLGLVAWVMIRRRRQRRAFDEHQRGGEAGEQEQLNRSSRDVSRKAELPADSAVTPMTPVAQVPRYGEPPVYAHEKDGQQVAELSPDSLREASFSPLSVEPRRAFINPVEVHELPAAER